MPKKCIYCGQDDPLRFQGVEHVIPQSFGTFGSGTPTLSCVCDDCNSYFGRELDQLLARETLEGISRYTRGRRSRDTRQQKRLAITLADGPETGALAGMKVFIDGKTGKLMKPQAQFHVMNLTTEKNEVYLEHQIADLKLPETIYGRPGKRGEEGVWKTAIFAASKEEHDSFVEKLQSAGIDFTPGEGFQLPVQEGLGPTDEISFPVFIEGEVDTAQKRAMTKVLMNFVAYYLSCEEALKPRWDFLRRFVRWGEGAIKARMNDSPFWTGHETLTRRLIDDSINVRIGNLDGHIVGAIQFYSRYLYEFILAEDEALLPTEEVAFRFTPGHPPITGGKGRREA